MPPEDIHKKRLRAHGDYLDARSTTVIDKTIYAKLQIQINLDKAKVPYCKPG